MPTSKDKSVREAGSVYRSWFKHWRTGEIIRAADYGKRAFKWPKRPKRQ